MPLNPCGRVTDFARREYRTKVRFFKDSDQEVDVQVYRAAPGAPRLGFPSAFMSQDWLAELDEPWETHLGEVWGEPRPYSFHGPLIDVTYDHVCGTAAQFRDGVEFDPTRNVKYDDQGLPECCNGPLTAFLGIELGLEVEVTDGPGPDCATAADTVYGVLNTGTIVDAVTQWWRVPYAGGDVKLTTWSDGLPLNFGADIWCGNDCFDKTIRIGFHFFPSVPLVSILPAAIFGAPNSFLWFEVKYHLGTANYSFKVETV